MSTPVQVTHDPIDGVLEEVRVAMARKRWNQRDLARALDVHEQWVSRRFTKGTDLSVGELFRIAEALGVEPRDLLPPRRAHTREEFPARRAFWRPAIAA